MPTNVAASTLGLEASAPSVQLSAHRFQAADAAGETLATAADLGVVDGRFQQGGRLSRTDRLDLVRFEVASPSNAEIRLDRLSRDADLYVLNSSGDIIASSTRFGRRSESLSESLGAGEYFLGITAESRFGGRYRLTLDVSAVPPTSEPPTSEPPASEPPTEAETSDNADDALAAPSTQPPANAPSSNPSTTAPLGDVGYFGGTRDWNINAVAAPEAWAAGYTGQGITVAVVDSGVDLDHPDLINNLYVNPGEIAGNGIDDDGNGYVDDISGYDFVSRDARPDDGNGHGTHVAGTIAATNNGFGATGVAPGAKILPVRVLDNQGSGSDYGVAAGIRYAAEVGAHIINLSLGGGYSARIASAIEYATSLGSLVVAAAGNESAANPSYPARYSSQSTSVLSVGAFDSSDRLAGFSNDVGRSGSVQIDAPGVGIYSTYIGGRYGSLSGTSMASPHVAGVAALTLSANPSLTSAELRELLSTGTVGKATGSDAIGSVSAKYAVAYAAAGLTTSGGQLNSSLVSGQNSGSRVRATNGGVSQIPSDFLASPTDKGSAESHFESPHEILFGQSDRLLASSTTQQRSNHQSVTSENQSQNHEADETTNTSLVDDALSQWDAQPDSIA